MGLRALRNYIGEFRAYNREREQVVSAGKNAQGRLMGRIVRYVHSVEKGMSIENPRPGFGYDKIKTLYGWIKDYLKIDGADRTCVYMAADALAEYCAYHESIGAASEKIDEIKCIASELGQIKIDDRADGIFGGVLKIKKEDMAFDSSEVEKLFKTRHSIRQFSGEPVPSDLIRRAVELAQSAPSACNRQAVRLYAVDTQKFVEIFPGNLQGVGGFIDESDKVILITGKISAYEESEYKQFIVSAGIFAGYLSLSLHGLGLGACIVQRSLRPDELWREFSKRTNIPSDEQIVCMVVVGQLKDETVVPASKRFDTDTILGWL